jgi:hypothetical protein
MKNNFIITESEKKRILGLHNKYINKPQTWVIKEEFTGTAGDGYNGDVAACKKDLPYNVAVKTGQIKSSSEWKTLRKAWGSDGSMTQNLKMRDEMCDGWRSGDSKESSSESETTDQTKKAWLDKQAVSYSEIDKTRFEPFTTIPNYNGMEYLQERDLEDVSRIPDEEIKKYYPKFDDFLVWFSDSNLIGYRDTKKEDLKMYLENGNIVSKSPGLNSKGERDYKYLGKWK